MIRLKNISFDYGKTHVLTNINMDIPDNGITAIISPSGGGKTSLLRILAGLEVQKSGSVAGMPEKISYVFQEQRLLPWFSALENVAVVNPDKGRDSAAKILSDFGLTEELYLKRPGELSGGERQRVCIARALFYDGDILLLDEPFNGLDRETLKPVIKKIKEYSENKAVVLVSHNQEDILSADKVVKLLD